MRVLITGGAGFIGSHLAEALILRGDTVDVIDDLSTGSITNLDGIRQHSRFSFTPGSAGDYRLMVELVDKADVVFHLAAAVGVKLVIEKTVRTIETNIKTTELVLELCALKLKPVLIASTSEVYGKLDAPKFSEESDLVLGPTSRSRWCYASTKIIDEFLAQAYFSERGLPTVVVRLFNTIGPRQTGRYGMVVPSFVEQARRNKPITVYGDGSQRRSFTWIGDVIECLILLVQEPKVYGEVFNLGHTKDISIFELALLIKEMTVSDSEVLMVPYEEAFSSGFEDMKRRLPDLSKIREFIGYNPSLDLRDMLERII